MKYSTLLILLFGLQQSLVAQELKTGNKLIDQAFSLAVWTLDTNTHDGIVHAGAGYGGEWTRDCAINAWNAVSMLRPESAEHSLWSVTNDSLTIGHQYWDKILWVPAAWNQYLVTGDKAFLRKAYLCSKSTMKELEDTCYEHVYGLFMGPAVFQDGIAAYDEPIYDPAKWDDSFVLHHKYSLTIKCLSTNVAYYIAYRTLAQMARREEPTAVQRYLDKADKLKAQIRKYFYHPDEQRVDYVIDHRGVHHAYQEGIGLGLALLTDIFTPEEAQGIVSKVYMSQHGIPCVYPSFPRNTPEKPGRHNVMIWPHVNMFYAAGCAHQHILDPFYYEMNNVAGLAMNEGKGSFYEIYTLDGTPSGGWQCGALWAPKAHQTWCATGYINLFLRYVFGLNPSEAGLEINPLGMPDCKQCQLKGLKYRKSEVNITLKGQGSKVKSFKINGKQAKMLIPADAQGKLDVVIVME